MVHNEQTTKRHLDWNETFSMNEMLYYYINTYPDQYLLYNQIQVILSDYKQVECQFDFHKRNQSVCFQLNFDVQETSLKHHHVVQNVLLNFVSLRFLNQFKPFHPRRSKRNPFSFESTPKCKRTTF